MHILSFFDKRLQRFSSVTLLGVMVTLLASACGESKIAQCNKLIEVINKGEEIDQKFEQETEALADFEAAESFEDFKVAAGEMSTAFGAIADDVETYLEEVDTVELSDEELIGYQATYAEEGETFSGLLRNASDLFGEVSGLEATPEGSERLMALASGFNEFSVEVDQSSQAIDQTIDDINGYCGVTPDEAGDAEPEAE